MRRRLFDDKWTFLKTNLNTEMNEVLARKSDFYKVSIPHDFLIYNGKDLYEDANGWYSRKFSLSEIEGGACEYKNGDRVYLYFEGVYMDSTLFVNGREVIQWKYGYSSFYADITDYLIGAGVEKAGNAELSGALGEPDVNAENEILVKVVHQSPNSRWYSGAGIFRDIYICCVSKTFIPFDGTSIDTKYVDGGKDYELRINTEVANATESTKIKYEIVCPDGVHGVRHCEQNMNKMLTGVHGVRHCEQNMNKISQCDENSGEILTTLEPQNVVGITLSHVSSSVDRDLSSKGKMYSLNTVVANGDITEWSIENPYCYKLRVILSDNDEIIQVDEITLGFRDTKFTTDAGFFLNGKHVKLYGVCEHHDFGCIGSAYSESAMIRKFNKLKAMGVNALRTSHNMPAKNVMDLADKMGILVVSEAFDMWARPKTEFDYGRFFNDWCDLDVRSWIRRDRNHPSLIMWSIGNEIYDTHAGEEGYEITKRLMALVKKNDAFEHAKITLGSNYMPWENTQKCADLYKIAGYNYGAKYYEAHHEKYKDWVIYGSETDSIVMSRGVYRFPYEQQVLADDDEQCSSLGNSNTSWGAKSVEHCIADDSDVPYSLGQFIWTGFDYIGEPTPYHTRNSYFGQIDTAGFPKDSYYVFMSKWADAKSHPMVHLFPYWDFNEGQEVDVRACSNGDSVELFVNGESKGIKKLNHVSGIDFTATWKVPYVKGEIKAVAYDKGGQVIAEDTRKSFGDAVKLVATADKTVVPADGRSLIFIEISAIDAAGNPVDNAMNYVSVHSVRHCEQNMNELLTDVHGVRHCEQNMNKKSPCDITGDTNGDDNGDRHHDLAYIVGMDNGDSTDFDEYKSVRRKMFNGKLLAVLLAGKEEGEITVTVSSDGLESDSVNIKLEKRDQIEGTPDSVTLQAEFDRIRNEQNMHEVNITQASDESDDITIETYVNRIPARKVEIVCNDSLFLTKENNTATAYAKVYPENSTDTEVVFKAVNNSGIDVNFVDLICDNEKVTIKAKGDGDFWLRALSKDNEGKVRLISQLQFNVSGIGQARLNPYEFITGGLYTEGIGEVGNGNEKGFATASDGTSGVVFRNIDFGEVGSDEITMPIFALSNDGYPFKLYEGDPENGKLIMEAVAQQNYIWNVYQDATFKLPYRLKGVKDLSITFDNKVHVKGFIFKKYEKAYEKLYAAMCDHVYGDQFDKNECDVTNIGNNVVLEFNDMDFSNGGPSSITISGRSELEKNTIHIHFIDEDGNDTSQIVEFLGSKEYNEQKFELTPVNKKCKICFVFLPGCKFDFEYFRFTSSQCLTL